MWFRSYDHFSLAADEQMGSHSDYSADPKVVQYSISCADTHTDVSVGSLLLRQALLAHK